MSEETTIKRRQKTVTEKFALNPEGFLDGFEFRRNIEAHASQLAYVRSNKYVYKILPRVAAEDLEAELNKLVEDGWHDIKIRAWVYEGMSPQSTDASVMASAPFSMVEALKVVAGLGHDLLLELDRLRALEAAEKSEEGRAG